MAQSKEARRKRKYGDKRQTATARNKTAKARRHDLKMARMVARTQALVGTNVQVRVSGNHRLVGTVSEILSKGNEGYPLDAHRHTGSYLKVRTNMGDVVVSRHRSKPLSDRRK